jgi:hypothetical protein
MRGVFRKEETQDEFELRIFFIPRIIHTIE